MMAKPMKTLELHYPMIQFLIRAVIPYKDGKCTHTERGFFNKTVISLMLVVNDMVIANSQGFYGSWKVLEFHSGIFQDWKVLEKGHCSWKVLEICLT